MTKQGYADLRRLPPVKRAEKLIAIAHPKYQSQLRAYFEEAKDKVGGQTPHILEKAFAFHTNLKEKETMLFEEGK